MKTCHAGVYPGNVAKYRLLLDLREALRRRPGASVLDVGCVGPGTPLELWASLLGEGGLTFHVTGIDVDGLDRAAERVARAGWSDRVELARASAYEIGSRFQGGKFDFIVSTQVMEHLAHYGRFIAALPSALGEKGEVFLSFDSAHFGGKYPLAEPGTAIKRGVKKALALVGREGRYDVPLYERDLEPLFARAGLEIVTRRHHNLGPMKRLQNHVVDEEERDEFLETLWRLEERVNTARRFGEAEKRLFRCLYYRLRRPSSGGDESA